MVLVELAANELRQVSKRAHQRLVRRKLRIGAAQHALPLDEDLLGAVDHDLRHGGVVEEGAYGLEEAQDSLLEYLARDHDSPSFSADPASGETSTEASTGASTLASPDVGTIGVMTRCMGPAASAARTSSACPPDGASSR